MTEIINIFFSWFGGLVFHCWQLFWANYGMFWLIGFVCVYFTILEVLSVNGKRRLVKKIEESFFTVVMGVISITVSILIIGALFSFVICKAEQAQNDLKIQKVR